MGDKKQSSYHAQLRIAIDAALEEGPKDFSDFLKKLEAAGFEFSRHGGNHDVYVRGSDIEQIPRHKEINEMLAKAILRKWGL
jgi:mRNA interferase HicA